MAAAAELKQAKSCKVIGLLDMDAFECQVNQRLYPQVNYFGKPCIVVDQTGRIVSATSEAKDLGISRDIRQRQAEHIARKKGVDLKVFTKPNDREKPDAKEVRYASWHVVDALKNYCEKYAYDVVMEYASSDEFYLDITSEVNCRIDEQDPYASIVESRTFLECKEAQLSGPDLKRGLQDLYWEPDTTPEYEILKRLLCGGLIVQEINNFVFGQTKMVSSVGVSTNKLLAKIAVGLNKPNGITILPESSLSRVGNELAVEKIPGFGGTFGAQVIETLKVSKMNELKQFEFERLEELFGEEKALEIIMKSHGWSEEPVKHKLMNEEVSSGKTFFGQIRTVECLKYHMYQLTEEIIDRMAEEETRHRRQPSIFRFQICYTTKSRRDKGDDNHSWTRHRTYTPNSNVASYCDAIMDQVLHTSDQLRDLERNGTITITRIEVRAKQFVSMPDPAGGNED